MPVKYECPKCGRRFAEWGAEKLGFKCPQDDRCPASAIGEDIALVRLGVSQETAQQEAASLRRRAKPAPVKIAPTEDDEATGLEEAGGDGADLDDDDDDELDEGDEDETEADGEVETETTAGGDGDGDGDDDSVGDGDDDDADIEVEDEAEEELEI